MKKVIRKGKAHFERGVTRPGAALKLRGLITVVAKCKAGTFLRFMSNFIGNEANFRGRVLGGALLKHTHQVSYHH